MCLQRILYSPRYLYSNSDAFMSQTRDHITNCPMDYSKSYLSGDHGNNAPHGLDRNYDERARVFCNYAVQHYGDIFLLLFEYCVFRAILL